MGHYAAVWDHTAAIEVTKDWNGIDQVVLRNPQGASARVSLQGGQVTSWRNDRGEELLFNSSKSIFKSPKATRGGISVCFPQYGNGGSLEPLGFARNKIWTIEDDPPSLYSYDPQGKSFIDLLLKPSEDDLKFWPHGFEFRVRVTLSSDGSLSLISRIRNINGKQFSFSFAYHTYFSVSDISEIRIEGLETLDYLDNLCQKERFTEQGDAITFESESLLNLLGANRLKGPRYVDFEYKDMEYYLQNLKELQLVRCGLSFVNPWEISFFVKNCPQIERLFLDMDRVYLSSPNRIAVLDHERKRTYLIRKEGLPDTVVWNPWEKKAKAMADFGDEEYKQMLCVDGAAIEKPISLKPGEEWTGCVELVVVPSSFCDL